MTPNRYLNNFFLTFLTLLLVNCSPGGLINSASTITPTDTITPTFTNTSTYTPTITLTITPSPTLTKTPIPIIGKWNLFAEWGNGVYIKHNIEFKSDNSIYDVAYSEGFKLIYTGAWANIFSGEWDIEFTIFGTFNSAKFSGKVIDEKHMEGKAENASGIKGTWYAER
jgi:hypothetical protein